MIELEGYIQTLGKEAESLNVHSVKQDRLIEQHQCLAQLRPTPHITDTAPLELLIAHLVGAEFQFQREGERSRALKHLDSPPVLDDAQKLRTLCQALFQRGENRRRLEGKSDCLGVLNYPPVIDDIGPLERIVADLESARLVTNTVRLCQPVLQSLTPPPQLKDAEPLAELIRQLEDAFRHVDRHEASISAVAAEMAKVAIDVPRCRAYEHRPLAVRPR